MAALFPTARAALDLSKEPEATLRRYGRGPFGLRVLAARRLVEACVRCVTVGISGWDTHGNNFAQLRNNLLSQLDKALSALMIDLDQRGLLETTIIYCTGEFGRTPYINGNGVQSTGCFVERANHANSDL